MPVSASRPAHDPASALLDKTTTRGSPPNPVMAQYLALKAEAGDALLFYRMGDFFELFFGDAHVAAACLDIAVTERATHGETRVPMCGVPVHSATSYLQRLILAGHRVAVAEQTESAEAARRARGAGALVGRAIVRVVTAGPPAGSEPASAP